MTDAPHPDGLRRLLPEARRLLSVAFLRGERPLWPEDVLSAYYEEDGELAGLELTAFDEAIAEGLARFGPRDPALDAWLARYLHATLPLTRRQASEPARWRYLTIARAPQFVRHRWDYAGRSITASRFWNSGTRHTSNALERLWWIVELLRGPWPDDAALPADLDEADAHEPWAVAQVALRRASLTTALFARSLSHYEPLARACIVELHDAPNAVVEHLLPELRTTFSMLQLESHDEALLRTKLRALRDQAPDAL